MCEWQPLDGGLSVVQQIANGGDENAIMREAYAKYFGRGPFMGDPIGTLLKHQSFTTVAQTDTGGNEALSAVMGALMHQGTIGESDKVKLLEMGFPGARTDEEKMLRFFESEATAREWCNVWHLHTQSIIADVDPTQVDQDDFTASASTGSSTEACRQRRVMNVHHHDAGESRRHGVVAARHDRQACDRGFGADASHFAPGHLLRGEGDGEAAHDVVGDLPPASSAQALLRVRAAGGGSPGYAPGPRHSGRRISTSARSTAIARTLCCPRCWRPSKAPSTINPLTTLQTAAKEYKEFKTLVTPVLESVKSLKAKNLPDALKAVNEKMKKLDASNEELKRALRRKADKDGGGGGNGGGGGKGDRGKGDRGKGDRGNGKRKKAGAVDGDADEEEDGN
jgi:hypothetical protein